MAAERHEQRLSVPRAPPMFSGRPTHTIGTSRKRCGPDAATLLTFGDENAILITQSLEVANSLGRIEGWLMVTFRHMQGRPAGYRLPCEGTAREDVREDVRDSQSIDRHLVSVIIAAVSSSVSSDVSPTRESCELNWRSHFALKCCTECHSCSSEGDLRDFATRCIEMGVRTVADRSGGHRT